MPPTKPVASLFDTSLRQVTCHLIETCKVTDQVREPHGDNWIDQVSSYIHENLIASVKNCLLKKIMYQVLHSKFDGMLNTGRFKETVNGHGVTMPVLGKIVNSILLIFSVEGTTELDLQHDVIRQISAFDSIVGNHCKEAFIYTVYAKPLWAHNLVSLNLKYVADSNVLRVVAVHCHNLQYLNIESLGEPDETDPLVSNLCWLYGEYSSPWPSANMPKGCPKLQTLILPKYRGLTPVVSHVLKMVVYMPDLCCVRNVDTRLVTEKYLEEFGEARPLKLIELEEWPRSYVNKSVKSDFTETAKIVPSIRSYKSYSGELLTEDFYRLSNLASSFACLEQLVLYQDRYNNLEFDLKNLPCIPSIKGLELDLDEENIILEQVHSLSRAFPNLKQLKIHSCGLFTYMNEAEKKNEILFDHLELLDLHRVTEMDTEFLSAFLKHCPKLVSLSLSVSALFATDEDEPVTHELIYDLRDDMHNLERVLIMREYEEYAAPLSLTLDDAIILMAVCPKLSWLGKLGTWCVTEREVEMLIAFCKGQNRDLHISYSQTDCISSDL
ncbi:uncharacterized protein LOC122264486 [Penaeus japonicus]|uniref:uncharacterized protein LOC122264486 n=1 Tax=Penaeus japonicus TaxID=27405 RepID=UPI001C717195|nr:uncharacterized protein LOC122264486 [Penaeus japonicus]XP_042889341.1 uncharacterized protein LOC122264486 [Penaeus japonicus]XP_042889342.1 uncharacterized protein LOC122264486 [Penaeus japonicus]XP_042889343.1 uncharacterized protein LOC122264486 [Penaeus japonicus]XP_042889344.1 uncharacterized protein LOC122264486 [Penaeus japonicus]